MKEKDLKNIIKKLSEIKIKNFNNFEWDSLLQLSILMELEKKFPGKITSIKKISEINTYQNLLKVLKKKKIIND
tara:strand:+ start:222 stop:443 length:222 start_codon:yes stop_codon:yes gene_type:complete